ncbi:MAG: DUF5803 family protein [Methanoregulaceae archaeon]|jgi:hypothetical protein|nr:DUF5803 family protein [Methanoregulaceae archaeon]
MQSSHRDRCRPAVAALCIALLLIPAAAQALTAEYHILPNGTAYQAAVEIVDADRYSFSETGFLGERIPVQVSGVSLSGDCPRNSCNFSSADRFTITFPKGNYTVHFVGTVRDNHFLATFTDPYTVKVTLPPEFDVRNHFIGSISPGAGVTEGNDGTVVIAWNSTRNAEVRFYTEDRVTLLTLFGQFWIIIAVVLLIPFLFTWKRKQG